MILKGCTVLLSLILCAEGTAQNSLPWPSIPEQRQPTTAAGPVNVFPISVVKGVSSLSVNGTAHDSLEFENVGDSYTCESCLLLRKQSILILDQWTMVKM